MPNISDDVTFISRKYLNQIKKETELLEKQFGITYFATQKITFDGGWSIIGNHPEWLGYSADNQFYQYDPSLIDPNNYQTGISFCSAHDHEECQNTLMKTAVEIFNIDHCLAVIEKNETNCQFTFLATNRQNHKIINIYINKIDLLRKYIRFFNKKHNNLLRQAEERSVNLIQIKPETYYAMNNILDVSLNDIDDTFDIQKLGLAKLSKRQEQCLYYFLKGKTAKETAQLLNLSHRTVEEYLNHLKKKLGCRTKRDLLSFLK